MSSLYIVGYAYIAKGSGDLIVVRNPEQFNLPHVFPVYAQGEEESEQEDS